MNENEKIYINKNNEIKIFDNINETISLLSKEISNFLSNEIEELNVSSHIFTSGLNRALIRVLNALIKDPNIIVIFPDTIPGFTLITIRKIENVGIKNEPFIERNAKEEPKELSVLKTVMNNYFSKNKQTILLIENIDFAFALCPVNDARKNLKSLDLYISY